MSLFIDETPDETPERKIERLSGELDSIETELRKTTVQRQELVAGKGKNLTGLSYAFNILLREKITELEYKRQNNKAELEKLLRSKKH